MRPTRATAAVLLSLSMLTAACGDDEPVDTGDGVDLPDRAADLVGTITVVTPFVPITEDCIPPEDVDPDATVSNDDPPICTPEDNDVVGSILVEEDPGDPQGGRKISYTVTTDSTITGASDGVEVGDFADFAEGQLADTWTTGACAESYPEQCTLDAIRVTG